MPKQTLEQRFWAKVDRRGPDECWPWLGTRNSRGYGQVWRDGHKEAAHRVAWELHHGHPVPRDMLGCHHCDNPPCVNPRHIFVGSMSDNILDAVRKGRPIGPALSERCSQGHELTPENVYVYPDGSRRECLICKRRRRRAEYALDQLGKGARS